MDWKSILNDAINIAEKQSDNILDANIVKHLSLPVLKTWSEGTITAEWELDDRFLNSRGGLFGGYYGILSDSILSMLAMTVLEENEFYATTDLRIQFYRTITSGTIVIKGNVINKSRSFVHVEALFYDQKENLLAKAYATQAITSMSEE